MLHIVFNEAEVNLLQQVMELDPSLEGPVRCIQDDFAVGPIAALDTEEGWQQRMEWWRQLLSGSPYGTERVDQVNDRTTVQEVQDWLTMHTEQECWIWMGQNQHDVSGYYWLMPQLRAWQGRVMLLYMNNLPFLNEKGQLFYPAWLSEIQPREFLKAKKLARPITLSEYEIDPDEWRKLAEENAMVRWLEGGKKLVGKEVSCYDQEILRLIAGDWQKATRVMQHLLSRLKNKTGDVFIMSRIKALIAAEQLEVNGDSSRSWKDFEIKNPRAFGAKTAEAVAE